MSRLRNAFLTVPEAAYIAGVSPAGHVALAEDAGFHHVLVLAGLGVIAEIRIILVGQLANYDRSVGAGILDDLPSVPHAKARFGLIAKAISASARAPS
jgi:hypothetical protein